jgi:hypothetical protein
MRRSCRHPTFKETTKRTSEGFFMTNSAAKPQTNKQFPVAKNLRSRGISCLIFLAMTTHCNYSRDKTPNNKNIKETRTSDGQEDSGGANALVLLQDQLFKPFCISCHNSSQKSGGVDLETFEAIASSRGSRTKSPILVPGKPQESSLFMSIVTGQMPPGPKKPGREMIRALATWIETLAPSLEPSIVTPPPIPQPVPTPPAPVEPTPTPPAPLPSAPKITFADIQKKLIDEHCIFCHEGEYASGNVTLETYDGLMKNSGDGRPPLVIPGNLEQSLFYQSIIRSENPMPPGDERLPQDLVDLVKTWIETGAGK